VQEGGYRQLQNDGLLLYGPGAPGVHPDHHHQLDHELDDDHQQLDDDQHDGADHPVLRPGLARGRVHL
jgi:hypothetical protein